MFLRRCHIFAVRKLQPGLAKERSGSLSGLNVPHNECTFHRHVLCDSLVHKTRVAVLYRGSKRWEMRVIHPRKRGYQKLSRAHRGAVCATELPPCSPARQFFSTLVWDVCIARDFVFFVFFLSGCFFFHILWTSRLFRSLKMNSFTWVIFAPVAKRDARHSTLTETRMFCLFSKQAKRRLLTIVGDFPRILKRSKHSNSDK